MTSIDTGALDALISAVGWVLGVSMLLVGGSAYAFAFWWAPTLRTTSLGKPLARAVVAWIGIGLVTFGAAGIAIGTESLLGYPFGASSGGLVLFAYLLGMRLATWELAVSHGLLHQLHERTGSGLHLACAWTTAALYAAAWSFFVLLAFICFVVGLNMTFGT